MDIAESQIKENEWKEYLHEFYSCSLDATTQTDGNTCLSDEKESPLLDPDDQLRTENATKSLQQQLDEVIEQRERWRMQTKAEQNTSAR